MSEERPIFSEWRETLAQVMTPERMAEHRKYRKTYRRLGLHEGTATDGQRLWLSDLDLRGARDSDLVHVAISNCDLSHCYFPHGEFKDTLLIDSRFFEAELSSADFGEAELRRCLFRGAHMQMVDFHEALVGDSSFENADLQRSRWREWRVTASRFMGSLLIDAVLASAFDYCNFRRADLRCTVAESGQTEGGRFSSCDFTGANFDNRSLAGATFSSCVFDDVIGTPVVDNTTLIIDPIVGGPKPGWMSLARAREW